MTTFSLKPRHRYLPQESAYICYIICSRFKALLSQCVCVLFIYFQTCRFAVFSLYTFAKQCQVCFISEHTANVYRVCILLGYLSDATWYMPLEDLVPASIAGRSRIRNPDRQNPRVLKLYFIPEKNPNLVSTNPPFSRPFFKKRGPWNHHPSSTMVQASKLPCPRYVRQLTIQFRNSCTWHSFVPNMHREVHVHWGFGQVNRWLR